MLFWVYFCSGTSFGGYVDNVKYIFLAASSVLPKLDTGAWEKEAGCWVSDGEGETPVQIMCLECAAAESMWRRCCERSTVRRLGLQYFACSRLNLTATCLFLWLIWPVCVGRAFGFDIKRKSVGFSLKREVGVAAAHWAALLFFCLCPY